jgi:steroid delta-isomerase-like uncharacterized protein
MSATDVVTSFFEAYRNHDTEQMVDLCDLGADFSYVPFEAWGRQRVVRGDGKVCTIGKTFWTTLIDCFPNLSNDVTWVTGDDDGNVAVEVNISGTQAKHFGTIGNQGLHYDLPHVFLFHVNEDDRIDDITAYWDGADWNRQLGRIEVD